MSDAIASAASSPVGQGAAAAAAVGLLLSSLRGASKGSGEPKSVQAEPVPLPLRYDAEAAAQYFGKRKLLVLKRIFEIVSGSASFVLSLKLENDSTVTDEVRARQAVQLRDLLSKLGPTFVKAGQALSIRVDLLPEVYLKELRTLHDRVPPFPTDQALAILDREFASKRTAGPARGRTPRMGAGGRAISISNRRDLTRVGTGRRAGKLGMGTDPRTRVSR